MKKINIKKFIQGIKYIFLRKTNALITILLGIIIGSSIGVYAANTINSDLVLYNNSKTSATTVKGALDELINTLLSKINTLTNTNNTLQTTVNGYEKLVKEKSVLLSEIVGVGDYVAYDAGSWTTATEKPSSHGNFGGNSVGSKSNSVSWCYDSSNTTSLKGWRVLNVNTTTNVVTIVHAGQPECYYGVGDQSASITNLNNRATSQYLNSDYADSAHMMNYIEAKAITGSTSSTTNNLRATGTVYLLASLSDYGLYYVNSKGIVIRSTNSTISYGMRPVVVLKPNIKTTGKTTDAVGQEAWSLVKP